MFSLFIPMGWGAPHGPALVVRNSVAVVPDVAGEVTDVPVQANQPLKAGDVLFKIGVEVQQIYTRYIEPGQEVELTFKFFPGQSSPARSCWKRQRQARGARYPQGHPAADRDIELRQPLLRARRQLWRGGRPLTETEQVR
jgi:Biotin-lipoyl like